MEDLIYHEVPNVKLPTMVVAFAGWPDAAEVVMVVATLASNC